MLRYFNYSFRSPSAQSPLCRRANWEIFILLEGSGFLLGDGGEKRLICVGEAFVCRPGHLHGWRGNKRKWEAAVLHYSSVPAAFEDWLAGAEEKIVCLDAGEIGKLRLVLEEVRGHYDQQRQDSPLIFERALLDICLMAMRHSLLQQRPSMANAGHAKADEALAWFESHLEKNPKVEVVAKAVHISASQLRRIFRNALDQTPKMALDAVRIKRTKELMAESTETLDVIARKSGFANANELCRVFRRLERGFTPAKWRKRILSPDNDLDALRKKVGTRFQE